MGNDMTKLRSAQTSMKSALLEEQGKVRMDVEEEGGLPHSLLNSNALNCKLLMVLPLLPLAAFGGGKQS